MDAADQGAGLLGMAVGAVNRRRVVRMGVTTDVGMTGATTEAAMDAGMEQIGVHAHVVSRSILHRQVAMAGEAVGLRLQTRPTEQQKQQ